MDIAITGSHGLIGTALASALRIDGHRVIPVPRGTGGLLDVTVIAGVDAVVHLAGAGIGDKRWTPAYKRVLSQSRTGPTRQVAEALAALPVGSRPTVLVSGSAVGYYGDRGDEVLTEQSGAGDLFLSELCQEWEAATHPAATAGVRVVNIRTGLVLSGEGGALAKQLPLFKAFLGGRFGSGRQWQSWISIDDEVGAIRWALDHDIAGPVNLTAPEPVTNAEFARTLGRVLGRPAVLPIPAFGPKLLLGTELAHELLFASQRVVPAVLTGAGYPWRHRNLETALRAVLERPAELA